MRPFPQRVDTLRQDADPLVMPEGASTTIEGLDLVGDLRHAMWMLRLAVRNMQPADVADLCDYYDRLLSMHYGPEWWFDVRSIRFLRGRWWGRWFGWFEPTRAAMWDSWTPPRRRPLVLSPAGWRTDPRIPSGWVRYL